MIKVDDRLRLPVANMLLGSSSATHDILLSDRGHGDKINLSDMLGWIEEYVRSHLIIFDV